MKLFFFFFIFVGFSYSSTKELHFLKNTKIEVQNTIISEVNKKDVTFENVNRDIDFEKKILLVLTQKINDKQQKIVDIKKEAHFLLLEIKNLQKGLIEKEYIIFILLLLFLFIIIFTIKILKQNKLYKKLSQIDVLSGLFNRRFLINRMEEEISKYKRDKTLFSILLIDIDYFKAVNDKYGHAKGDEVIKKISDLMNKYTRNTDICARWGGEEFIILATNTNLSGALKLAETFREVIEKSNFEIKIPLTISTGVSTYNEGQAQELVLKIADERLYKAKRNGKNRVEFD